MVTAKKMKTPFSLEVFPPKADVPLDDIIAKLGEFSALEPEYISVTFGTDGSNAPRTLEIADTIKNRYKVDTIAHLTCMNATFANIDERLENYKQAGISNILALRGDKREGLEVKDFKYATDLISYIVKKEGFSVSAACYPESHPESGSLKKDYEVMKIKADLGVTHFITQLFFDNEVFFKMLEYADVAGIEAPIQAGIMPVTGIKQLSSIVKVSGVQIPKRLAKQIERFEGSPEALRQAGMNFALEQISELIAAGADGIHLYTMNNPETARYIKNNIGHLLAAVND